MTTDINFLNFSNWHWILEYSLPYLMSYIWGWLYPVKCSMSPNLISAFISCATFDKSPNSSRSSFLVYKMELQILIYLIES